jgi:CPA2 family monovalent cation:H+ antiporter-2
VVRGTNVHMSEPMPAENLTGHVIIAGYGIVGRCVADALTFRNLPFCIVELNSATCLRLAHREVPIIEGDIRDPAVLQQAGIQRASALALAMPDEQQMLQALRVAREMRPNLKIIARCQFSSAGLQATQLGAAAVVAEQVVAREFTQTLEKSLPFTPPV